VNLIDPTSEADYQRPGIAVHRAFLVDYAASGYQSTSSGLRLAGCQPAR
jgi:hypothetical protein